MVDRLPSESPQPLDYRSPRHEPRRIHPSVPFTGGMLLGFVGVGGIGATIAFATLGRMLSSQPNKPTHAAVIPFLVVAVAAVMLSAVVWIRGPRPMRRWLLLGLLVGL